METTDTVVNKIQMDDIMDSDIFFQLPTRRSRRADADMRRASSKTIERLDRPEHRFRIMPALPDQ